MTAISDSEGIGGVEPVVGGPLSTREAVWRLDLQLRRGVDVRLFTWWITTQSRPGNHGAEYRLKATEVNPGRVPLGNAPVAVSGYVTLGCCSRVTGVQSDGPVDSSTEHATGLGLPHWSKIDRLADPGVHLQFSSLTAQPAQ